MEVEPTENLVATSAFHEPADQQPAPKPTRPKCPNQIKAEERKRLKKIEDERKKQEREELSLKRKQEREAKRREKEEQREKKSGRQGGGSRHGGKKRTRVEKPTAPVATVPFPPAHAVQQQQPPSTSDDQDDRTTCCICMERKRNARIKNCEHIIMCVECAVQCAVLGGTCPMCRVPYNEDDVVQVFLC